MVQKNRIFEVLLNIIKSIILPAAAYFIFLLLAHGRFGGRDQMLNVLRQTVVPMLIAMGMSLLMDMGMWDFSTGAVVYAAGMFGGNLSMAYGWGIPGMVVIALIVALVMECVNGFLYKLFQVPCLVLSIAMALAWESVPTIVFAKSSGSAVISKKLAKLSSIPNIYVVFLLAFIIFYVVYHHSTFSNNVHAIGADIRIAHNAGVDVMKVKFKAFLFAAPFFGITGVLFISQNLSITPAAGMSSVSLIFDSMMGVFIAQFLRRYCKYSFALLIGVFTMRMLGTGLVAMGMSSTIRTIATGVFLLVILCFSSNEGRVDRWRMRRAIGKEAEREYRSENGLLSGGESA